MVVTRGITEDETFRQILGDYQQTLQAERTAAAPPATSISDDTNTQSTTVDGTSEDATAAESRKFVKCCLKDCRRRSPTDCIHKLCFLCCYEVRRASEKKCNCPPHYKETQRREEEDRYIESLLLEKAKPRRLPRFYEEKFTAAGQTVTIWCLRDFLRNKSFSEETLQQEQRQFRQRELVRRRDVIRTGRDDIDEMGSKPSADRKRSRNINNNNIETNSQNRTNHVQCDDDDYFKPSPEQADKRLKMTK